MTFLTPWLLYGLGALAVPIVIHLWQRKKIIKVPFSTLRFLKAVAARTSRSAKLENLFLLLLRCLIVALVVWAAARPVLSTQSTKLFGGNVPRTIAMVVDNSLSMTYRAGDETRLERAKRQAQAVIDDLKPGDEVAVIAVSDRATLIIAEPTVDHATARQAIEGIQPTEARTDLGAGLREARKAVDKALRGVKQIMLFTDSQESGWQFDRAAIFDDQWKRSNPKLLVVRPDDLAAVNSAVTQVRFDTPFAATGSAVRGAALVDNPSDAPRQDILEIRIAGEKAGQRPVEVPARSSREVAFDFTVPPLTDRWLQGTVQLGGDNLPGDDRRYFLLSVYQPPRVLIVEQANGPEKARPAFYLRKALTVGAQGAPIKTVTPNELDDLAVDSYSAVFLAGVPQVSDRSSVRLDRYLQSGGTVVLFPSDQTDLPSLARIDWLPAKPGAIKELPTGRVVAHAIEPQHPLFANSWDANTPFPALPQRKVLDWKLGTNARVLLTLGEGVPFIILGQSGTGRVIIVNASPDRAWGDFPLTSAFLPLVQQIARLSVARTGRDSNPLIGDSVAVPPSVPRDQALTLKIPGGNIQSVQPGAPLMERVEKSGFYEVSSAGEGLVYQFAANVDGSEANLSAISPETLVKIVPQETIVGLDALKLWLAQARGLVPIWPLLLLLALAVFAFESIYSNVMARRRAQGDEVHIKTGRLNKRRMGQPFRTEGAGAETPEEAGV